MYLKREILVLAVVGLALTLYRESNAATFNPAMEACICSAIQALLNPSKTSNKTTLRGSAGTGVTKTDTDNFKKAVNDCISNNGGNSNTKYEETFDCDIVDPGGGITTYKVHLMRGDKGEDATVSDPAGSGVDISIGIGGEASAGHAGGDGTANNGTAGGAAVGIGGTGRNDPNSPTGSTEGGDGSASSQGGTAVAGGGTGGQDQNDGKNGGNGTASSATGDGVASGGTGGDPTDNSKPGGQGGSAVADSGGGSAQSGSSGGGGDGTHGSGATAKEGSQGTGSTNSSAVPNA